MEEKKISFDEKQVADLLALLKKSSVSIWSLDNVSKLLQILVVVIGGCWAFYQFLTYEKEFKKLGNEMAQTTLLAAQFSYQTQTNQAALRQSELEHSVELANLNKEKAATDLNYVTSYRSSPTYDLSVQKLESYKDGTAIYKAKLHFRIVNEGEQQFETTAVIIDCFTGKIDEGMLATNGIEEMGSPATRWNPNSGIQGAINYQLAGTWSAVLTNPSKEIQNRWSRIIQNTKPVLGGLATGPVRHGEDNKFTREFLIRERPNTYLYFVINVCFNDGSSSEDLLACRLSMQLPEKNDN